MSERKVKLLREIINSSNVNLAAQKTERYGEWKEVIIGIGKDHVAYITMPVESYEELMKI